MQYPVSAQYAPLSGLAGMRNGRVTRIDQPKPEPTQRRVYEVPIQDQILNAVRLIDGPTLKQIKFACKEVDSQVISGEVSRMCKKQVIRADGANKRHRYYEF